jgi:hypothetical protein
MAGRKRREEILRKVAMSATTSKGPRISMLFRRGSLRGLLPSVLVLVAGPALAQNLLVNPGFDRDLAGWDLRTYFNYTGDPGASAAWVGMDALSGNSGSVRFRLRGYSFTVNRVLLSQCVAAVPGRGYTGGGLVRTDSQIQYGVIARLELYSSAGCAGNPVAVANGYSLWPLLYTPNDSNGRWLPSSANAVAGAGVQSLRFSAGIDASTGSYYSFSSFDGLFDDAFLFEQTDPAAAWILPSSAKVSGAAGSAWTTTLTLANAGADDALVTLKFLGHDGDGRSGDEKSLSVRGGAVVDLPDVLGTLFGRIQDFGAIKITTSSASVGVESETSTPSSGGTVGQALPAFGPADFVGAAPKTLAPVRENALFRTNLVLANATEAPLTAHVVLYAADGTLIGSRDADLPPLAMTQINHVASALGAVTLDLGRIAISTPTPGGLVAAYASVIDNATNDPRTLLPQDAPALPTQNLLVNHGFDRDLSGWGVGVSDNSSGYGGAGAGWDNADVAGSTASGSASLRASVSAGPSSITVSVSQCVTVSPGRTYGLRSWVRTSGWFVVGGIPWPALGLGFFGTVDCSGTSSTTSFSDVRPFNGIQGSGADWFTLFAPTATAPASAKSALAFLGVSVNAGVHGRGISAAFDEAVFAEGTSAWTSFLPAAASVNGSGGSYWTTDLSLSNASADDASVYLEFPGSGAGSGLLSWVTNVKAGETISFRDVLVTLFQRNLSWGPLRVTAISPSITVTAATSTPTSGGGTVGQAVVAFAPRDLIGAAAKSIAPVRDDDAFRTNLVVANATDSSLTAHVELFDAGGALVGSRDFAVGPLAATQINGVGWSIAGTSVNPGRISVSTPTPGGLVAAYASIIDNKTNDPRTILPR